MMCALIISLCRRMRIPLQSGWVTSLSKREGRPAKSIHRIPSIIYFPIFSAIYGTFHNKLDDVRRSNRQSHSGWYIVAEKTTFQSAPDFRHHNGNTERQADFTDFLVSLADFWAIYWLLVGICRLLSALHYERVSLHLRTFLSHFRMSRRS
jgi:hypothetical protein